MAGKFSYALQNILFQSFIKSFVPKFYLNILIFRLYDQYSFQVIPILGQLIAGQWKPYQYLVESIRQFPNQVNKMFFTDILN